MRFKFSRARINNTVCSEFNVLFFVECLLYVL